MIAPRLKLNVFGGLGFRATDRRAAISNSFYIGSLDLFMTSRLSDRVSMLGELLFISNTDNSIQADIERAVMTYRASPYFNFGVGRFTPRSGTTTPRFTRENGSRPPSGGASCTSLTTRAVHYPCKK